jgi:lectin family protein
MRARRFSPLIAGVLLIAAACGDNPNPLPTQSPRSLEPSFAVIPANPAADAQARINELFPVGILRTSATKQLAAVVADMTAVPPRLALAKLRAWALIAYTVALKQQGKLLDPNGTSPPMTLESVLQLLCDVSIIAQLKFEDTLCKINASSFTGDGVVTTVNTDDAVPDVVVTESKNAALGVPPNIGNVLVAITRFDDNVQLQSQYQELGPKWRIAVTPTPTPFDVSDPRRFRLSFCLENKLASPLRPKQRDEPYVRVIHVHDDPRLGVTVPDPAPPLEQSTDCRLDSHTAAADPAAGLFARFANRSLEGARRIASFAGSLFGARPAYATGRRTRFDVGGVGAFEIGIGSNFPLGFVYPDLGFGETRPTLLEPSIRVDGQVTINEWSLTNQYPGRARGAHGAGEIPGDVALHEHSFDGEIVHEINLSPVLTRVYLSRDPVLNRTGEVADRDLGGFSTPRNQLIAGADVTVPIAQFHLPEGVTPGEYFIILAIDDDNLVPEAISPDGRERLGGEDDNIIVLPITLGTAFDFKTFDPSSGGLNLVGDASLTTGALRVVPAANGKTGAAWSATKHYLYGGFETVFTFSINAIGGGGADGFAFVIQSQAVGAMGGSGGYLGYDGLGSSLAVEFDIWQNITNDFQNSPPAERQGDPNASHISVHTNGAGDNRASEFFRRGSVFSTALENGEHTARIRYVRSGGTLEIFFDNSESAVISIAGLDLAPILDADGRAWIGFTGGTGDSFANHDILSWSLRAP